MKVLYRASRVSVIVILACLVIQAMVLFFAFQRASEPAVTIGLSLAILIAFLMFFSYQITVTDESLFVSYGIGLIRSEIPLSIVSESEVIPNISLAWIYDPFTSHVLRLRIRGGGSAVVGIGDPKHLQQLIRTVTRG